MVVILFSMQNKRMTIEIEIKTTENKAEDLVNCQTELSTVKYELISVAPY